MQTDFGGKRRGRRGGWGGEGVHWTCWPREEQSIIDHAELDTPRHASLHLTQSNQLPIHTSLALGSSVSAGPETDFDAVNLSQASLPCLPPHVDLFDSSTTNRNSPSLIGAFHLSSSQRRRVAFHVTVPVVLRVCVVLRRLLRLSLIHI